MTDRCGLSDRLTFQVGDALQLPFANASFDAVFLQRVAMNIPDRARLYDEVHRLLTSGGRFVSYDAVLRAGDVVCPTPWALEWFNATRGASPQNALNLALVLGPDFPVIAGNVARNIRENRLGLLSTVVTRG